MYFLKQGGNVYHVLSDARVGAAPCGARLSRFEVSCLSSGRPTHRVVAEKPIDALLCKQCEKRKEF